MIYSFASINKKIVDLTIAVRALHIGQNLKASQCETESLGAVIKDFQVTNTRKYSLSWYHLYQFLFFAFTNGPQAQQKRVS